MGDTIYQVLHVEHNEIKEILEQLACSSEDDALMRFDKQFDLEIELISHQEAEMQIFNQGLSGVSAFSSYLHTHQREHEMINQKTAALVALDVTDLHWIDQLEDLKEAVELHINNEEEEWLPEISRYISETEAMDLAKSFEVEKALRRGLLTRM